ncbi:TPA: hypothetical protein ACRZ6V_004642 [Vibrio harveyi]|nr:hypothetical protein [Vibrio parahaemolyticus]EJG1127885.1 hypothetical protein [Vibrio parahaemolyticus]
MVKKISSVALLLLSTLAIASSANAKSNKDMIWHQDKQNTFKAYTTALNSSHVDAFISSKNSNITFGLVWENTKYCKDKEGIIDDAAVFYVDGQPIKTTISCYQHKYVNSIVSTKNGTEYVANLFYNKGNDGQVKITLKSSDGDTNYLFTSKEFGKLYTFLQNTIKKPL